MKTWREVFNHIIDSDLILDASNHAVAEAFNVPEIGQMTIGNKVFRPEDNKEINAGNNVIYLKDIHGKVYSYTTWNANKIEGE